MLGVRQSPEKVKRANKAYSFDDVRCLVMATHQPAVSSFLIRLGFAVGLAFVFVGFPLVVVVVGFRLAGPAAELRTGDRLGVDLVGCKVLLGVWAACSAAARFATRSSLTLRFFRLWRHSFLGISSSFSLRPRGMRP